LPRKNQLRIKSVVPGSIGQQAGLKTGDVLVEINGHPVGDLIDYQFHAADESLDFQIKRSGKVYHFNLQRVHGETLGLEFEPMQFCACGNHCIFCFIDQNPRGMRETIYFKDEDYRLSFLFGNYVTLTRVNQDDLDRIIQQRLSPLYISIHAIQPQIRKRLLGIKREDGLLEKMDFLVKNKIEIHGQIVLCPGINDGQALRETVEKLAEYTPCLRSVSLVPVGLTKHREGLPELETCTEEYSKQLLKEIKPWQEKFNRSLGEPFIYLADELYIRAGESLPKADHYHDFWQIDNGVGMMRWFLDEAFNASSAFPKALKDSIHMTLVSGMSAGPILRKEVLPLLRDIKNLAIQVHEVQNKFYGDTATVTGLLTGQDIITSCQDIPDNTILVLPPNCLNHDGLFLDDLSFSDLSTAMKQKILIFEDWGRLWEDM